MKKELKEKAKQLRKEGKSLGEIVNLLGVSKSTASVWTRPIKMSQTKRKNLDGRIGFAGKEGTRKKYLAIRKQYQQEGREQAKKGELQHLLGCTLYWAEGTKSRNVASLANTDANVICAFKKFVDTYFPKQKYTICINCYLNNGLSKKEIEDYWLGILKLDHSSLRKGVFKEGEGGGYKKNKHKFGVCSLRVCDTHMVQHIYGAIQEYCGFVNEEWL
ncbi:MAG: hypothetical protein M0R80_01430 [Proteobacteria bacterium]|jgi:hypothetical protein|nr:hypothetical protein [Pseudomonadota bacterium]